MKLYYYYIKTTSVYGGCQAVHKTFYNNKALDRSGVYSPTNQQQASQQSVLTKYLLQL